MSKKPEQASANEQIVEEQGFAAVETTNPEISSPAEREIERLNQELEAAKAKAEQNWDKALRTLAELDNIQRRAKLDVEHAHKYANEKLLDALIPVIDSVDHALEVTHQANVPSVHEGLEMTLKMFVDTLSKFGVLRIDPQGQDFNPALHEAMAMQPVEGMAPNKVVTVFQKGYQLNGRLVRPARVVVSR
jgi:molecular chaperone GrpE